MTNETQQLTVADLEAAKKTMDSISRNNSPYMKSPICDPEKFKSANIAATCIGIVEEMVKCKAHDPELPIRESAFSKKFGVGNWLHFYGIHEVWNKAVAMFGGEVK